MCFDQKTSFAFAGLGLGVSYYIFSQTKNTRLAIGVFYFFLMELLQGLQYFVIDDCDNWWNKGLTILGYAHICGQPFFTHVINSALTKSESLKKTYTFLLRLCALGGAMLFARFLFSSWGSTDLKQCPSTEWLQGEKLCTYRGKLHLAWSLPLYEATYYVTGTSLHFFLIFAPFFVLKSNMWVQGLFLFLTGPFIALLLTPNLQEQASIWCFFSIAQISIMLFFIREQLLLNWGRNVNANEKLIGGAKSSLTNGKVSTSNRKPAKTSPAASPKAKLT